MYAPYKPNVNIFINTNFNNSNGTYILINAAIAINGPNGMYSLVFFLFTNNRTILRIAPMKNDKSVIIIVLENPKNSPSAATNFTAPNPIVSFP